MVGAFRTLNYAPAALQALHAQRAFATLDAVQANDLRGSIPSFGDKAGRGRREAAGGLPARV
jgi:hypothetical protein